MQIKILLKSKKAHPPVTSQQRKHFHKKCKVPTNPVKVATATLVGEWHHRAPHLFTTPALTQGWTRTTKFSHVKATQTRTPSSHLERVSTPVRCPEKPATITTWIRYTNSSLCFSHSEPFSSFHAPNTPEQSAFPLPSACPSLFASDTNLICSKDSPERTTVTPNTRREAQ